MLAELCFRSSNQKYERLYIWEQSSCILLIQFIIVTEMTTCWGLINSRKVTGNHKVFLPTILEYMLMSLAGWNCKWSLIKQQKWLVRFCDIDCIYSNVFYLRLNSAFVFLFFNSLLLTYFLYMNRLIVHAIEFGNIFLLFGA